MIAPRSTEALILLCLGGIIAALVFAAILAPGPARYLPAKGRQADYDRFMQECVAHRASALGHMDTCNQAAAELGLAVKQGNP